MISRTFTKLNKSQLFKNVTATNNSTGGLRSLNNTLNYFSTSTNTPTENSNNNNSNNNNNDNSNNSNNNVPPPKSKMNRLAFWGGLAAAGLGGFWVIDMIVNDDFDSVTDRFRTRLPESERFHRPKVVILGTGWASLCFLKKLHTDKFDVTIISPRNYFLFTPLLVGSTTGTVEVRSIMEPIRKYCNRTDSNEATFYEAECLSVDPVSKKVKCFDNSAVKGEVSEFELDYDHLIVGVGADNQTFGIPGVRENACFLKEINDTRTIRDKMLDCLETASYPNQPQHEIDRLLSWIIVGGGPSGVEFAAEITDFLHSDLLKTYPLAKRINVTLVEALPHILTIFDKKIIDHVEKRINSSPNSKIWTKTAVVGVKEKEITIRNEKKEESQVPYGLLVWATGNTPRTITSQLMKSIGPSVQNNRRGLIVDDYFRVAGADGIWSIGDASINPSKPLAQTAQVASQQGRYLGRLFNDMAEEMNKDVLSKKELAAYKITSTPSTTTESNLFAASSTTAVKKTLDQVLKEQPLFKYKHMGTLAYVGDHQAIAEFKTENNTTISEGYVTFFLWRSVYFTKLLSIRNRANVTIDWVKTALFGRDVSRG